MTPVDAVVGETRSFSITGANLPTNSTLDVTFNGCANIVFAPGQSANLHQFTCVPQNAGTITAVIRTLPGTTPLGTYSVAVAAGVPPAVTPLCSSGVIAEKVLDIPIGANHNWGANSCVFNLDGPYGSSSGAYKGYLKLRHSDTHVYALIDLATLSSGFQHWFVYSAPSNNWNSLSYQGTAISMYFNPSGSKGITANDFEIGLYPGLLGVAPTGQADYPSSFTNAPLPQNPTNGEKYSTYTYLARSNKIFSSGNWYNTGGIPIGYKLKINSGATENGFTNHIYYEIAIAKSDLGLVQTNISYLSIDVKYFNGQGSYAYWKVGDAPSVFKITLN
jgi:hypothetical protein